MITQACNFIPKVTKVTVRTPSFRLPGNNGRAKATGAEGSEGREEDRHEEQAMAEK